MNKELIMKELGEKLYNLFKRYDVLLAGGAIRSIYCKTLDKDSFDFYKENVISDLDIYFRNNLKIKDLEYELEDLGYYLEYTSTNALTYRKEGYCPIQLVILENYMMEPTELLKKFDFSICTAIFDFKYESFYIHEHFEEDNKNRILRFNTNTEYPLCSLIRVNKYTKHKKYTISNIEYLKIALSIHNLTITSLKDLKNHLKGIDTTILTPLIETFDDNAVYDMNAFLNSLEIYLNKINSMTTTNEDYPLF